MASTGWEVRFSKSKQRPYFYNSTTSSSIWDKPEGMSDADISTLPGASLLSGPPPSSSVSSSSMASSDSGKIRASHLLVKWSGSRRPSSWKEPNITRSKEEAMSILKTYEDQLKPLSGSELANKFGELATVNSDCGSHSNAGDLGLFGKGQMQPAFENATYALQVGQMSGPVESDSVTAKFQQMKTFRRCLSTFKAHADAAGESIVASTSTLPASSREGCLLAHSPPAQIKPTHNIHVASLHFRSYAPDIHRLERSVEFARRAAAALDMPCSNVVHLPTRTELQTVLRGPFVHKKSQQNFWRKTHKRMLKIYDTEESVISVWLDYLNQHAVPGVGYKSQVFIWREKGFGRTMKELGAPSEKKAPTTDQGKVTGVRQVEKKAQELIEGFSREGTAEPDKSSR